MKNHIYFRIFIDGHLAEETNDNTQDGELFQIIERLADTESAIEVQNWSELCEIGELYEKDDWSVLCCYGSIRVIRG